MNNSITVTATIHADIKKVWDYYTKPEHIVKWNFADPSWHCPSASNDMHPGGKYKARMEAKDGSFGFDFEAVYDEVVNEEKFVYTMTDGRQASIVFENVGNKTNMIVTFEAEMENPADMQKEGWQAILNNFKSYVEAK